jgi:hypothetical protein
LLNRALDRSGFAVLEVNTMTNDAERVFRLLRALYPGVVNRG